MQVQIKSGSRPPWVGLAGAIWVQFAAGNIYTFPLYSHTLKSVLGFTQQQITILGVANDFGESVGILPGIICNNFPPWIVLSLGNLACFVGYGLIWLSVTQTLQNLPYWLLWISLLVAANSSSWFGTAVLVTNMRNFPLSRGTVAGLLKGYIGISAAMYTVIYSTLLDNSASHLLLFLTIGLPIICVSVMYVIRPCTPASEEDNCEYAHFLFTQGACILLGIYLLTTTIINDTYSIGKAMSYTFVAIMVVFMLAPLAIPIKMTLFPLSKRFERQFHYDKLDNKEPLLGASLPESKLESEDVEILLAVGEGAVKEKRRPRRGDDFKFCEAFIKADFWLLWLVYFFGVGSGVTVLNNLAQIGYAQGEDDTTTLLSLFAFCNFLGRLGGGAVSEHFVRSKTLPRTIWMSVTQVGMVAAFLLYAFALSGTLYISTALLGICYGVQFATMIPTTSELFGLKHFGVIYNFVLLGNPIGALIFSGFLAGSLYDTEATKQGVSTCLGASCFKLTFFILSGVCGLGATLGVILTIRIRPVYEMLYAGGSFRLPQRSDH